MNTKLPDSAISVLGMLTLRPMSGYEVKQTISESIGYFWDESYGQLYPQLKKLASGGHIVLLKEEETGARARKTYAITDLGRQALAEWLYSIPKKRSERNELLLKIFFASEGEPARILEYCRYEMAEANRALQQYRQIEQQVRQLPHPNKVPYWLMTLRYGITFSEARVAWCAETIETMQKTLNSSTNNNNNNNSIGV